MNQPIQLSQFEQYTSARHPLESVRRSPRSLYIHVPFCFHKCHYCDFYSFVDARDRQPLYTDTLCAELRAIAHAVSGDGPSPALDTIFVGGGTPTLLEPDHWRRILDTLHNAFTLRTDAEFTVESNPETTRPDVLEVLARGGVNRISIGAQTFNATHLRTLERHHDPQNVRRALQNARDAGINRRSIDLIFAIPSQTIDDLRDDLRRAIELGELIEHISLYNLMYEPNTALTQRMRSGAVDPIDEQTEIEMYELVNTTLEAHGMPSYEISNFARPGAECRHNLAYWRQDQWLAAGPSASAHAGGYRWKNVPHLSRWMQSVNANGGFPDVTDLEAPDPRRALAELLMTGLRLVQGFDAAGALAEASRLGLRASVEQTARSLERDGIIEIDAHTYRLTAEGRLLADEAGARFIESVCG